LAKPVKKAMVIGLDAPIPPRIYKYAKEGKLPTIGRLIREGVWGENCLVPLPTITPPNWTTITTGATLGTHGITCFNIPTPGAPLNEVHQAFNSAEVRAERMWTAAERAGKRTIVLNYPTTWPPTVKIGYQVGGAGLSVNEWRCGLHGEPQPMREIYATLAQAQVFTTEALMEAGGVKMRKASGWRNMPKASEYLEADLKLQYNAPRYRVEDKTWHMLVMDTKGKGYDRVLLSETKDAAKAFASLSVGEWTGNVEDVFETELGPKRAAFRCKLLALSEDAEEFRLFVTPICALSGWSYPESLAEEIKSKDGLPMPIQGAFALGLSDSETIKEAIELHHAWLADAAVYLLRNKPWDLYFMHAHCPDTMHHRFATQMDPATAKSPEEAEHWQGVELALYQSLDRMIARILSAVDEEETLIIMTSDHGAKASTHRFTAFIPLAQAGLLSFKGPEPGPRGAQAGAPLARLARQIDWARTKAVQVGSCHIYVNLRGRDPDGIVEPGEEYEQVRDQVIKALYEYTDPETGKKPFTLALRREDARIIGLHGDRVGDVVFAISGDFGGQHGPHLPTTEWGIGSLRGLLIMKGPGVKRNYIMKRTAWLMDIVPTICHLMDLPVPRDAEGAILYQALEDPDAKPKELRRLRKEGR